MTTFQKTIIASVFVATLGAGIYEARQAAIVRSELQTLNQQQIAVSAEVLQLKRGRDEAASHLAALRDDNARLSRNGDELLKLRAETARLRAEAQRTSQARSENSSDSIESAARTWVKRVAQLKQQLSQTPQTGIPELKLLSEEDWLAAVKGQSLETDMDYRRALSTLRRAAEEKFGALAQKALRCFTEANHGQFPADIAQLQPCFDSPIDVAILDRWKIADQKAVPNVGVGDFIITQKSPVDDVFDDRLVFSVNGHGATDFLIEETKEVMNPVFDAYRAAHSGQSQNEFSQLLPYATTPEQQAALSKLVLRFSARN